MQRPKRERKRETLKRGKKSILLLCGFIFFLYAASSCFGELLSSDETVQNMDEKNNMNDNAKKNDTGKAKGGRIFFLESLYYEAEEGLYKTVHNISTKVKVEQAFDDNILRTRTGKVNDFITTVATNINYIFAPNLSLIEGRTKFIPEVDMNLDTEMKRYAEQGSLNRDASFENVFSHFTTEAAFDRLNAHYDLQRMQRTAADLFCSASSSPTLASRNRKIDFWVGNYGGDYSIGYGRWNIVPAYSHTYYDYENSADKRLNSNRDNFSLTYNYEVLTDIDLVLRGTYGITERPKSIDSDSTNTGFSGGLSGKIAPRTTCSINVGRTSYDSQVGRDVASLTGDIDLQYNATPQLDLFMAASRSIQDVQDIAAEGDENSVDANTRSTAPDDTTDINSQFAQTDQISMGAKYTLPLDDRISCTLRLLYNNSEYDSGRLTKTYNVTFGLSVQLKKWLRISGGYSFRKQLDDTSNETLAEAGSSSSSVGSGGYENNIYTFTATAEF